MRKIIPYNPKLKEIAKKLRKQGVLSEVILWTHLKNKQLRGIDFHRQKPIDNYIVDFYCPDLGLVVEIDGISHAFKVGYDIVREKRLRSFGLEVLHFDDEVVKRDIDSVLAGIDGWVADRLRLHTPALPRHPSQEGN